LKPIIGMETYMAPGSRLDRTSTGGQRDASYHLVLLAKDEIGYRQPDAIILPRLPRRVLL